MELGFRTGTGDVIVDEAVESRMITGDLNIVAIDLVVQYRIKDLGAFLFNVADPGDPARPEAIEGRPDGRTLKDAAEAALRQVVGQRSIDDPLRVGREVVQVDTQDLLQQIVDDYNAGIEILNVQLQEVQPPDPGARRLRRRQQGTGRPGEPDQRVARLRAGQAAPGARRGRAGDPGGAGVQGRPYRQGAG